MRHREIFAPKYFREIAKQFALDRDVPDIAAVRKHVANWQVSWHNGTIIKQSEIQLQKDFLATFFAGCLGYRSKIGHHDWELDYEQTTALDGTRADGYLGFFAPSSQRTVAVIELKPANTDLDRPQTRKNDKRSPVEQAFSYVPKVGPDCRWVIVSNFREIRLYHAQDQGRYEVFDITQLHEDEQLTRFLFLLHRDRMLPSGNESYLEHFYLKRLEQEQTISEAFYRKFKELRLTLFGHFKRHNPDHAELLLFEKTQKLLDRMVFVFFCEDKGLLPFDMTRKVMQSARASLDPNEGQAIWGQLKGLFRSIDKGNPPQNINRYNGGLFAHDPALDELHLGDKMAELLLGLSNFDFDSDLDVNILGHIFEQSISDIEEIKADLTGLSTEKKTGKRKKDGIFYTPEYITRYIVREAVGGWLDDRKREIGFDTLPELSDTDLGSVKMLQSGPRKGRVEGNSVVERHRAAWVSYRQVLAGIKVLDPACGSGAFLIQVFDFLSAEAQNVNDEIARLTLGLRSTDDLPSHILTHNIFGVDINRESVDITKLSLWLKTANNQSELTALDANIRCGNSLIDEPAVAGELAFNWQAEFSEIFEAKGGFDVVVGNPPYGADIPIIQEAYFKQQYIIGKDTTDTYALFMEKCRFLLNQGGIFGFITPESILRKNDFVSLREFIFSHFTVLILVETGPVFSDARDTWCLVSVIKNQRLGDNRNHKVHHLQLSRFIVSTEDRLSQFANAVWASNEYVYQHIWQTREQFLVGYLTNEISQKIIEKIAAYDRLGSLQQEFKISRGEEGSKTSFPENTNGRWFMMTPEDVYSGYHTEGKKVIPDNLAKGKLEQFYSKPKIWIIRIQKLRWVQRIVSAFDERNNSASMKTLQMIVSNNQSSDTLKVLQCILVSKLINFWCINFLSDDMNSSFLAEIPIPIGRFNRFPNFQNIAEKYFELKIEFYKIKEQFLQLVQAELSVQTLTRNLENWEMLDFKAFAGELAKQKINLPLAQKSEWLTHFEQERARAQALLDEIRDTDHRINEMVFDLYELTPEERAVVLAG